MVQGNSVYSAIIFISWPKSSDLNAVSHGFSFNKFSKSARCVTDYEVANTTKDSIRDGLQITLVVKLLHKILMPRLKMAFFSDYCLSIVFLIILCQLSFHLFTFRTYKIISIITSFLITQFVNN